MFKIDRERKTIWAVAPNGAKFHCCSIHRHFKDRGSYYALVPTHERVDGDMYAQLNLSRMWHVQIPEPGSEESKTPEAAFEAVIKYLGLAEPTEPSESEEVQRLKKSMNDLGKIIHDEVVLKQAAWIEWKHGRGAEAAMRWIQNALVGPGFIPDEDEPYNKEAQAYYDANTTYKLPTCYCGRPSNRLWMGQGFCSTEHYEARRAQTETQENSNG